MMQESNGLIVMRSGSMTRSQGGFIQQDPLESAGGFNLYQIC